MSWGFLAAVGPRLTAYVPNVEAGGLVPSVATTLPANVQDAWQHPRQPICMWLRATGWAAGHIA